MISTKKRRQAAGSGSSFDGYSRTLPRPSDIARNLATPTQPNSSSSSSNILYRQQPASSSSSSSASSSLPSSSTQNRQPTAPQGLTPSGLGRPGVRAVANPYDDLNLYSAQINAVHKPDIRSGDPNHGNRGRVSATSGGYFGYNKPTETSGYYGFNKHSAQKDQDARYGHNTKPHSSTPDTKGHYGFNKSSKTETKPSGYYGYNKPGDTESKAQYGYNKPDLSDPSFSGRYGFDRAHMEARSSKLSKPKASVESAGPEPYRAPPSSSYSMTLPWSGRYGKYQTQSRSANQGEVYHSEPPAPPPQSSVSTSRHMQAPGPTAHQGFIYEGHTHYPYQGPGVGSQYDPRLEQIHDTPGDPMSHVPVCSGQSNHLQQLLTSTPKPRREVPPPPVFEDHHLTSSPLSSSSFSSPEGSSSVDYTATLPAKLSRSGRSQQAPVPPHLQVRCDLGNRFTGEEMADQQRSQSMSPRVYRSSQTGPIHPSVDPAVRETRTPPASGSLAFEAQPFNSFMGDLYDPHYQHHQQQQQQHNARAQHSRKKGQDPRGSQGNIPAPPKQHGLAATLNYHQQLRKELGMPQSSSPVPHPSSSMSPPFKYQQYHHLSDGNIPATPTTVASGNVVTPEFSNHRALDRELDLLTTLAYDGNSRRYYDAFQNLHGHNSTPHLPSATSPVQTAFDDQPLFGSDPNLLRKCRQPSFDTFYDNIFFSPPNGARKPSSKSTTNITFPPANSVVRSGAYPLGDDTQGFPAQFETHPGFDYARPSKSYSSLPTSTSTFNTLYNPQDHTEFRDWSLEPTSPLTPPPSSSCAAFPFPTAGPESFYSSTSVHGLCTLPRNSHSAFQHAAPDATPRTISLSQKEPSYEEITNITPALGKEAVTARVFPKQSHPDISAHHSDGHGLRQFPVPSSMHGFAPAASSINASTSVDAHGRDVLSHPAISTGMASRRNCDEQAFPTHHSDVERVERAHTGKFPTSDMNLEMIEANKSVSSQPVQRAGNRAVDQTIPDTPISAVKPGSMRSGSIKVRGERLPGSVSDRAHRFEQKASGQSEAKKKTGIPTFTFVRLRNKNAKAEKSDSKPKEKNKPKREIRNLDSSFEKEEKTRLPESHGDFKERDSFGFTQLSSDNLAGERQNHHGVYEGCTFPMSSIPTYSSTSMVSSSLAAATTTTVTTTRPSIPLLTFSSSPSSSSPPRHRLSNPEDAGSREAAFLAVTGSDATTVTPARGQQTTSMHESGTGSVDVDSFSDFLLASGSSHNYHLFSRRKKPLPGPGELSGDRLNGIGMDIIGKGVGVGVKRTRERGRNWRNKS